MSSERDAVASGQGLELYRELAEWYPLLTPVADYAEKAAFYRRLFEEHCRRPPRTLLDLGNAGALPCPRDGPPAPAISS